MKKQFTLLFCITTSFVMAQTNIWQGNSTAWNLATNWSLGSAPITAPAVDVVIPSSPSGGQFPVISINNPSIGQLTLQDGATITVNNNTFLGTPLSLIVNKTINAGTGAGSVINGTGFLVLQGASAQTISGKLSVRKFRLNNANGASLSAGTVLNVDSFMLMQAGTLTTTGASLVLRNNAYINNFSPGTYTGTISGPVTVQRLITNTADGYRNLSSPVATTVADLADDFSVFGQNAVQCWYAYNPYPNVQVYDENLTIVDGNFFEGWLSYTGASNPLAPMQGIAARTYAGAPYTIDFTGQPNDGPQSISITNTTTATPAQDGWNLVGNPYPSPIRWSQVKALNAGETDGSYYVYQTTGEYTGNWGSHNGVTGVNGARDSIGIGQGFFVLSTGNHTLEMNNTVRAASFAGYFKTDEISNEIRIQLSNGTNSDQVVTYTDANATNGYDPGLDAVKMAAGSTTYLSFASAGKEYAINVLNMLDADTELPLNVYVSSDGSYTFSALQLNVPGFQVYLHDASTDLDYDLAAAAPAFMLNAQQSYAGRFSLRLQAIPSSVEDMETNISVYAAGHSVCIKKSLADKAVVSFYNITGQWLMESAITGTQSTIALPQHITGYVMVKVTEGTATRTHKLFIR